MKNYILRNYFLVRKDLIDYYQSLVEKGITMLKRKNNPKKQNI